MGEISVHPLDGLYQELSIKYTKSILSIPVAPDLHQKHTPNNWMGGSIKFPVEVLFFINFL